jgi:hypothetical protein
MFIFAIKEEDSTNNVKGPIKSTRHSYLSRLHVVVELAPRLPEREVLVGKAIIS